MDILRQIGATNPRIAEFAAQVEDTRRRRVDQGSRPVNAAAPRGHTQPARPEARSLHGYQVTPDDAAMIRMLAGATFGADATVTLPRGITVTGAEMQRWLEAGPDA